MQNLSYLSKIAGLGIELRTTSKNFFVEEITSDGTILKLNKKIECMGQDGKFTQFILQKSNWSTNDAINAIAKKLRISFKCFNAAGMKDKNATTTQRISAFAVSPEQILNIQIKDIKVNGVWTANEKVKLGSLLGNRFTIKLNNANENSKKIVGKIYSELDSAVPNYFGEQRFGTIRKNTHVVGEKIIKGDFEAAVMTYLTCSEGEENVYANIARKEFACNRDFKTALKIFPRYLQFERLMIAHLAEKPRDYVRAFRTLPRNILLMFVHAFQSMLFNEALSDRIREGDIRPEEGEHYCEENNYGFPDIHRKKDNGKWIIGRLIGYETELNEREYNLLKKYNIKRTNFKVKQIPEISSKGTFRALFAPLKDFSFSGNTFKFSLPSGSYATMALREFLDKEKGMI